MQCTPSVVRENSIFAADLRDADSTDLEPYDRSALFGTIKSCGKHKDLHRGSSIHAEVLERGLLQNDIPLSNALLTMYARCGALSKAQELFDQLPARDIVSWNALITGYIQRGLAKTALACYARMLDDGLDPNAVTYLCILRACGRVKAVEKGEKLHAELGRQGMLGRDVLLNTAVVDMYAKCGALEKSQAAFDKFERPDTVMWNALLSGYSQNGFGHEALRRYDDMQRQGIDPDAVTFIAVLKSCGTTGAVEKGREIHLELKRQGLIQKDIVLGTALVDMYAKCGAFAEARGVFDELPSPNVVTWNALIAGYAHQGFGNEALQCFEQMKCCAIEPDNVTFICVLIACGNTGAVEVGEEIHAKAARQGFLQKDSVLCNALIDMYAKCGAFEQARDVLDQLEVRDATAWTALIAGYVQHGLDSEALTCYDQMRIEGIHPDEVTFGCILRVCGNLGALWKGHKIHEEAGEQDKDSVLGTALVDMYAKCGCLAKAQDVFDRLSMWNVAAWTALITGYAQAGQAKQVLNSFRKMTGEGIKPNMVTYVVILTACSHAGLVDEGQKCFETMRSVYHVDPTIEHFNCMVDIVSRAGQFNTAVSLIDMAPPTDRFLLWSVLIGACKKWADIELGRVAYEHTQHMDQKFDTAFICFNHLYAADGSED